jgi:hypothetical protein
LAVADITAYNDFAAEAVAVRMAANWLVLRRPAPFEVFVESKPDAEHDHGNTRRKGFEEVSHKDLPWIRRFSSNAWK